MNWRRKCDSCGGAANVAAKKSINNLIIIVPTFERGICELMDYDIRVEEVVPRTFLNFKKTIYAFLFLWLHYKKTLRPQPAKSFHLHIISYQIGF